MKRFFITLAVGLGLMAQTAVAQDSPKREFRSVWLTSYMAIDWPSKRGTTATVRQQAQKEMIEYIENHKKRNFTGVCFQVRSLGDAMYKSSYEPWSVYVSGTRGTDPGWDPLAFCVEECHKRGLECYAWVNPFRQSSQSAPFTTSYDKDWANRGLLLS